MRLSTLILAQAIEDILRFELGLPLVGVDACDYEDAYQDALCFVAKYPTLLKKIRAERTYKQKWLEDVDNARQF